MVYCPIYIYVLKGDNTNSIVHVCGINGPPYISRVSTLSTSLLNT